MRSRILPVRPLGPGDRLSASLWWRKAVMYNAVLFGGFFLSPGAQAQLRNANWLYNDCHISFTSGTAVPSAAPGPGVVSSSSLSDPYGNPLVYCYDNTVVNQAFQPMSGCPPLEPSVPGQGSLLMPVPGDPQGLVLVCNSRMEPFGPSALAFGRIDMELDGGLGGFVGGMTPITDSATWKLTAVAHDNGQDYWILTQIFGTDQIAAYLLDANGLNTAPVISHTGAPMVVDLNGSLHPYAPGDLVATRDGSRLAMVGMTHANVAYNLANARIDLLDLDPQTGTASLVASLPPPTGSTIDGMEFSPNGRKLYIAVTNALDAPLSFVIHQYDLSVWEEAAIIASRVEVFNAPIGMWTYNVERQLTLAPDGRIWFHNNTNQWLGVIDAPEASGTACTPIPQYLLLPIPGADYLPNHCQRYHDDLPTGATTPYVERPVAWIAWPNPAREVLYVNAPGAGFTARLYDTTGRLASSAASGQSRTATLDVAGLPAGLYVVRCTDGQHNSWTATLAKE